MDAIQFLQQTSPNDDYGIKAVLKANNLEKQIATIMEKYAELKVNNQNFTKKDVDFAYCAGVFNTGGIDALHKETSRLLKLKVHPHMMINFSKQQNDEHEKS